MNKKIDIRPLSKRSWIRQGRTKKERSKRSVHKVHEHFEVLFSFAIDHAWRFRKRSIIALFLHSSLLSAANPSITTVSVTVPGLVQITGLSDITLSPTGFSSPVTGATTACIYTNVISPLGSYYVTASSANASSGAFRVVHNTQFINYDAYWNATSSATQTTPLTSGVKTAQQSGGSSSSLSCSGTPNANFNISFSSAQVAGASAATYTDTVTLLISPS